MSLSFYFIFLLNICSRVTVYIIFVFIMMNQVPDYLLDHPDDDGMEAEVHWCICRRILLFFFFFKFIYLLFYYYYYYLNYYA